MLISSSLAIHEKGTRIQREEHFPYWTCGYFFVGSITMKSAGQVLQIAADSFVIIPPNCPYEFDVLVPDEHVWAIFEPPLRAQSFLQESVDTITVFNLNLEESVDAAIAESMHDTVRWWQAEPMRSGLAENALERALLLVSELEHSKETGMDGRVTKAISIIAGAPAQSWSVSGLAQQVGLSPSRFAALFRQETGKSPASYMEHQRLELACERLLSSSMTITEVAESVGYRNPFHFSTRFRALYEQSPRDFRKNPSKLRHVITPTEPDRRDS